MQAKVTVKWLRDHLPNAIDYHMQKMTYGGHITKGGLFSKPSYTPCNSTEDYWMIMTQYEPWNTMFGAANIILYGEDDTELLINGKAYALMLIANQEYKK